MERGRHIITLWEHGMMRKFPESKETIDKSENEDGFGIGGGYSSYRGRSTHSGAWQTGKLRDKKMPGGKKEDSSESSE
jgi:hypothetical protein